MGKTYIYKGIWGDFRWGGLVLDGKEGRLDECCWAFSAWCEHVSVSVGIHLLFLSIIVNSETLPFPPPFLLGPIICWLPSNWLRTVIFGCGTVYRDSGVCRGRSGLGPLGTDGRLRTISQRMFFALCVFVDLYLFFTLCILVVVLRTYHVTQVFISSLI